MLIKVVEVVYEIMKLTVKYTDLNYTLFGLGISPPKIFEAIDSKAVSFETRMSGIVKYVFLVENFKVRVFKDICESPDF